MPIATDDLIAKWEAMRILTIEADFVVIGSGLAGSAAAYWLSELGDVVILAKESFQSSNSYAAQGGIAAAVAPFDSPALHDRDTQVAGDGLCNPHAVETLTQLAPQLVHWLIAIGVPFDRDGSGKCRLGLEGAHSFRRILHAGGDASGRNIMETIMQALAKKQNVRQISPIHVRNLVKNKSGIVIGASGESLADNREDILCLARRGTILATGGSAKLFAHSTNPSGATGDGIALAYHAGAQLRNLEFVQFHPTVLTKEDTTSFLISEAVRGAGARLVTDRGEMIMENYPLQDLEGRDVVSRALYRVLQNGAHVHLDCRAVKEFPIRFPTIYSHCMACGLDPTTDLLPVSPAAHFVMGGIAATMAGATSVQGLYALGEVACTGVHGANRLASNSLLECLVMAYSLALQMHSLKPAIKDLCPSPLSQDIAPDTSEVLAKVQSILWETAGIERSETGLRSGLQALIDLTPGCLASSAICTATLTIRSALARRESRGAHYRTDYPLANPKWTGVDTVVSMGWGNPASPPLTMAYPSALLE